MRNTYKSSSRRFILVLGACLTLFAIGASAANAASTLQVNTDNNQARSKTAVEIKTVLSGSGSSMKQYGALINLPSSLRLDYYNLGPMSNLCSGASISNTTSPLGSVRAFTPVGCSEGAKVGTAAIGSLSGPIYAVRTTPVPTFAAYFDQGTSSPFGRAIDLDWESDGAVSLSISGLPNVSTSGLTLNFNNPSRPGGLETKIFDWAEPGTSQCVSSTQATAVTFHWPALIWPPFTTAYSTTAAPANLALNGCDYDFVTAQTGNQADGGVILDTFAGIFATGARQYGQEIELPLNIWNNWVGMSGPKCSGASTATISTGLTPEAKSFDKSTCPAGSIVGSATLGGQSGDIYLIRKAPIVGFGIWFDQGVTTPYGRYLELSWTAPDAQGNQHPLLKVFGLDGAVNAGLNLHIAGGTDTIFSLAPPGVDTCADGFANSKLFTYPVSGGSATQIGPLTAPDPIEVEGC